MDNNENYTLDEFILNESFRDYALGKEGQAFEYWSQWVLQHPEQQQEFEKAKITLLVLMNPRKSIDPEKKEEALVSLLGKIEMADRLAKQPAIRKFMMICLRVAAVLIVVASIAVIWNHKFSSGIQKDLGEYQIIVPIGEKSQIILPDGTHVWINSGSRFVYSAAYGEGNRSVYLEGEAYFDVTKKNGIPFTVNTKEVKIKVLGTAFNVKGYTSDKTVVTTVVRGLVKVESTADHDNAILVNPNEQAIYTKQGILMVMAGKPSVNRQKLSEKPTVAIAVEKINPGPVICWKDQLLVFQDETLEDMATKMERWYNVKIHIDDPALKTERFNGKFVHNETIYQVLEAIKLTTPIRYKVKDNDISIARK